MKLKNIICVIVAFLALTAAAPFAQASKIGPVPPCPWTVKIDAPSPEIPDEINYLLGEWKGGCEKDGWPYRNDEMIVLTVKGGRAMVYYGRGTPAGTAGSQIAKWVQIDAEILTEPLRLRWQWPSGKIAIFKFKNGSLVCPDPFNGTWYEIILQKNR